MLLWQHFELPPLRPLHPLPPQVPQLAAQQTFPVATPLEQYSSEASLGASVVGALVGAFVGEGVGAFVGEGVGAFVGEGVGSLVVGPAVGGLQVQSLPSFSPCNK